MYPLRSIQFLAELVHPPVGHTMDRLQKVHHQTFSDPAVRYANFQVIQGGAVLSNPVATPGAVSNVTLMPDRVRVQEVNTGMGPEDFKTRLGRLAAIVVEELGVPTFMAQQFLVQSLVNPRGDSAPVEFLRDTVLSWDLETFEALPRTPDLLGVRLRIPAEPPQDGVFQIRVENYERDAQSLFIENVGLFRSLVPRDRLELIPERFDQTYRTLEGPVLGFLSHFDAA